MAIVVSVVVVVIVVVVVVLLILLLARGCRFCDDMVGEIVVVDIVIVVVVMVVDVVGSIVVVELWWNVKLGAFTLFHCTVVCGKMSITLSILRIC